MPTPISEHGWEKDPNGYVIPAWNSKPFAPDTLLKYVSCACKKTKCVKRICSCLEHNPTCTELCKCLDSDNQKAENLTSNETDDDMDDEEEDNDDHYGGSDIDDDNEF